MSDPIELHVFGGRIGESIVVRLPGDVWGVVDNYTPRLADPESNPTLRFLKSRHVQRLRFLCLTHPHADHYRGISHLLEILHPEEVWLFGAKTHRDLFSSVAAVLKTATAASHLGATALGEEDELVRFLDRIRDELRDKARTPQLRLKRLELGMPLLDLNCDPPVRVHSIGASGGRIMLYEDTLKACFNPTQTKFLADRVPNVNHNMISGGLLLEYGQARIILGGDIDKEAWEETLHQFSASARLCSQLVKVSHHGSTNGYCDGLWQQFSPARGAIAVITPYSSQGLPSSEGLAHISTHAKSTLTPSIKAAALASDWKNNSLDTAFHGMSADALVTLRSIFPKSWPKSERLEGACSFTVNEDGSIQHHLEGEAGILSGA